MRIRAGVATDIGRVREGNEDSFLIEPPLYAVADGMGGHRGGDVASKLALETIENLFRSGTGTLEEQIQEANRAVFSRSAADRNVSGMGTTLTAVLVREGEVHLAHVGDSRAYLLRGGVLRQLTRDHTLVERMVSAGEISEEEAGVHPHRNVLTRVVGTEPDVRVDEDDIGLMESDRLLLCSDGLTGMVTEDVIRVILDTDPDPQDAADRLVRAANQAGGVDNITVVVLDLVADDADGGEPIAVPTVTTPIDTLGDAADTRQPSRAMTYEVPARVSRAADRRHAARRRAVIRWGLGIVATLVVLGAGLALFRAWVDDRWYVGVENGHVAIFQGIPAELLGFELSHPELETSIPAEDAIALPAYADLEAGINQDDRAAAEALIEQMRVELRDQDRPGGPDRGDGATGGGNDGAGADGGGGPNA